MLVDPLPGTKPAELRAAMDEAMTGAINLVGAGFGTDVHGAYIDWANRAAEKLGRMVSARDLDRLILTRRQWVIQDRIAVSDTIQARKLIQVELLERRRILEEAVADLDRQMDRWKAPAMIAIPDTSFYIQHPEKLEETDIAEHLTLWEDPIHVVVPILIVDELDRLKESKDSNTRWRAGYTTAVLESRLTDPNRSAVLRAADFSAIDGNAGGIPRGEVTIEILFDPPGHVRLPIDDDELVDRAVAVQTFAGPRVTIVTYDTGQAMRARSAGVKVKKLTKPSDPEPA